MHYQAARSHRRTWPYLLGLMLMLPVPARATELRVVAISPGRSAAVTIDGGSPITIRIGETIDGIKLLRADRGNAVLSVEGVTQTVSLATERGYTGGASSGGGTLTLSPDEHGQFYASATVNGRSVRFLVDTGASTTALSRSHAQSIGLRFRHGTPAMISTANGVIKGWRVRLPSIRIGNVTVRDIDAMVIDNDAMSFGLLGMTYLDRFDMQRQGASMVLRQRR